MTATTSVTGAPDTPPETAAPRRRRGGIFSKLASPFKQSHGVQRFMLVSGTLVSVRVSDAEASRSRICTC